MSLPHIISLLLGVILFMSLSQEANAESRRPEIRRALDLEVWSQVGIDPATGWFGVGSTISLAPRHHIDMGIGASITTAHWGASYRFAVFPQMFVTPIIKVGFGDTGTLGKIGPDTDWDAGIGAHFLWSPLYFLDFAAEQLGHDKTVQELRTLDLAYKGGPTTEVMFGSSCPTNRTNRGCYISFHFRAGFKL